MQRILILLAIAGLVGAVWAPRSPVLADEPLHVLLARVGASEAFGSPGDLALIWQCASRLRPSQRARWLLRHSPCATGGDCNRDGRIDEGDQKRAEMRGRDAMWSRNLQANGEEPLGWSVRYPDWDWTASAQETWLRSLSISRRLVSGEIHVRPCSRQPWTWGGRTLRADLEHAEANDLFPLGCVDPITGEPTRNEGFAPLHAIQRANTPLPIRDALASRL